MKAVVIYDSLGGNTEKAAVRIHHALMAGQLDVDLIKVNDETEIDFYHYDLIFMGSPVISWEPTKAMKTLVKGKMKDYRDSHHLLPAAPLRPGKFAVCFCTYGGPHTGTAEAVPLTKWLRAFFEHLGYLVVDEWHVVGQFHKNEEMNTQGRMGDISGRPNDNDLRDIENRVKGVLSYLSAWLT